MHKQSGGSGTVAAIWLKRARRGKMDPKEMVDLVVESGLAGNTDQGGKRQVTLISEERWLIMMRELGANVDPSARRANIMLRGIDLEQSRNRILRLGPCRLRILGETRPCERMDEAFPV